MIFWSVFLRSATCSFTRLQILPHRLRFVWCRSIYRCYSIKHVVSSFLHYTCYSVFKVPSFSVLFRTDFRRKFPFSSNLFWRVGPSGLEPPTSRLSGVRSNRLSYGPIPWWRWGESNPWPPACKAGALPAELHPRLRSCWLVFSSCRFLSRRLQNWTMRCPQSRSWIWTGVFEFLLC